MLSIGDEPLSPESDARRAVDDYVFEPRMEEYAILRAAVADIVARNGPLDRIESNGEYWLEVEARLRGDFGVPGLQLDTVRKQRSKLGMAALFAAARIPYPPTARASDPALVRSFAKEHGFPLVFKPEVGAGAVYTFCVANSRELERALLQPLTYHLVQPFITGDIVTYDGITDKSGNIVFATSHTYDVGIMQLRQASGKDGHYYSLREPPRALTEIGERAVRAFDVRERFFHIEFFAREDGSYVALEMNLRPPGGFTTDMMNYAADVDVYALWASIVTDQKASGFDYHAKYHTAHAGRRRDRSYRLDHEELQRMLGPALIAVCPVPPVTAETMGDAAYLLRHPDLASLKMAVSLVQAVW